MTPEVKQRIEQIQQGIVPEGYKKTKTDIVPADWKESPIGKYIREYTEKTTIPNQYPVLTSARTGLMLQTDYYSNRQVTTEDNVGYNILPYGYITFRSRSDDGRFRFNENRIIERGVISYFYPVFSFSEEVCHEYVLYLLNFSIYRRMYPYAEGTAQQVLSLKKLGQLKYSLPLIAEQKKIAEILATQDKAIELQGRKIEELKRFKKSCLERMFPRKGQKVPEKRFPGFTDDWERRKLTEFVEFFSGLTYTPNDVQENGTLVLRSSNVSNGEVVDADNVYVNPQVVNSENVKVGDIVVVVRNGSRSLIGKHAQIKAFMPNTVIGAFMTGIRSECPKFTNALLNTSRFEEEIAMNMGATINQITGYMFSKMEFKVPCLDEQKEIGEYFENLDRLITLHQRKLEEMKKQKKALMQLLLTGIVRVRL